MWQSQEDMKRSLAAMRFHLNTEGQVITLRNPSLRLPERGKEWYVEGEEFSEWSVLALPLGSDQIAARMAERMSGSNVTMGYVGYAFIVGDQLATDKTQLVVDNKVHQVTSVKGKLFVLTTPLVQEIVVKL